MSIKSAVLNDVMPFILHFTCSIFVQKLKQYRGLRFGFPLEIETHYYFIARCTLNPQVAALMISHIT